MGRQEEVVSALLQATSSSKEPAVALQGLPGTGKTAILERVSEELGNRPHRLLRANPEESTWPLSGLMSMLASVPLAEPVNVAKHIPRDRNTAVDRYALALEIQEKLLDTLSEGTVILIDDADEMDEDSQAIIGYLGSRLSGTRVSLIISLTSTKCSTAWAAIKHQELGTLSEEEARALAAKHAGTNASAAVLNIVAKYNDGRPATIIDLLGRITPRQLSGGGPLVLPLLPGDNAQGLIGQELETLSDAQRRIMSLAAMAPLVEPEALASQDFEEQDALEDLLATGWLHRHGPYVEVYSDLARAVLYWRGTTSQRRDRHGQLADRSTAAPLTAYHRSFLDAEGVSASDLLQGAQDLLTQGHIAFGIETAERALAVGALVNEEVKQLVVAVELLMDSLELDHASRILRLAQDFAAEPSTALDLALTTLKLKLLRSGSLQRSDAEPVAQRHRAADPKRGASLLCFVAVAYGLNGSVEDAGGCLSAAEDIFPGIQGSQCPFYIQATLILSALERRIDPILAAYRGSPLPGDHYTALSLGFALSHVERHEEAAKVFAPLLPAHDRASPLVRRLAQLFNATNELRANTFSGALSAIDAWRKTPQPDLLAPLPQILQTWYWLAKDEPEKAVPFIDSAHPLVTTPLHSNQASLLAALEGEYALMRDNLDSAIAHFRRAQLTAQGYSDGNYVRMVTNLIEALVLSEKFEEAANEYRSAQSLMATAPGRRNRLVTRRAHAMARPGAASLNLFQALIDEWATGDSRFEHARLLHSYASRLAYLGHADEARTQFLAARSLFTGMGAKGWAQRIDAHMEPRAATQKPATVALGLSRDEMHIIELLQQGLTNKEISNELYIAVSTVEVRLSKLYKKTGASNRHHLVFLYAA